MISRAVNLTPIGDVEKLSHRVIRILGQNPSPMTLLGTNSYLVGTGKQRLLIDTSSPKSPRYLDLLHKVLADAKAKIRTIVVTHHHYDHLGMVADVLSNGLTVPNANVVKLRRKESDALAYDFTFSELDLFSDIAVEGATLKPIATPGHCDDHASFRLVEENAIFIGDSVMGEGSTTFDDLHNYMRSLRYVAGMKPSRLFPGHGPVILDGEQRLLKYIAHREARERQIIAFMIARRGQIVSVKEVVAGIYPDIPADNETLLYAAGENVHLHFDKLVKDGLVRAVDNSNDNILACSFCFDDTHGQTSDGSQAEPSKTVRSTAN